MAGELDHPPAVWHRPLPFLRRSVPAGDELTPGRGGARVGVRCQVEEA